MFRKSSSISINTQETGAVTNTSSDIRERFFEVKMTFKRRKNRWTGVR